MKILFYTVLFLLQGYSQTCDLTVEIKNIKEKRGTIRVLLWNSPDGFPKDKTRFYQADSIVVTTDTEKVIFHYLPTGTYAVSLFQDLNNNKTFDKNRFAHTFEPFGLSGTPDFSHRPVKFDDCSFNIQNINETVTINLMFKEDLEKKLN